MKPVIITALYKFIDLDEYQLLRAPLLEICSRQGIKGTLLLAREGINGTVAGSRESTDVLLDFFRHDPRFAGLSVKQSFADEVPFHKMKVRLKKEIVTLGLPDVSPQKNVGHYVSPGDWNALICDPGVLLVDTRNGYEYEVGTFKGAMNPETTSFRDFPAWIEENLDPVKHRKVAMFCTGGIRCEKATSWLLEKGFENVYHLQGGILKYLEQVDKNESLWQGECFVFDQRVTVNHDLEPGGYDQCHGCRRPVSEQDKRSEKYMQGISCPHCFDSLSEDQKARFSERQKQIRLARERGEKHLGKTMPAKV